MFEHIIEDDTDDIPKAPVHADRPAQGRHRVTASVSWETLDWSVDGDGVATLVLDRPDALNAFDLTMAGELEQVFRDAAARRHRPRDRRHRRRAGVLRRHGPRRRGQRLRSRRVAAAHSRGVRRAVRRGAVPGRPARHRRQGHAGDPRLPQAGDRGDQRPGRRHRRHHDPGDGPPAGVDEGADRLRLRPARDRARGRVDVVPPADRGRPAGTGVDLLRRHPDRRAGPRRPAGPVGARARRPAARAPRTWRARSSSAAPPSRSPWPGSWSTATAPCRIRSTPTWPTRWRCSTPPSATAARAWRRSARSASRGSPGEASELPEIFPSRRD